MPETTNYTTPGWIAFRNMNGIMMNKTFMFNKEQFNQSFVFPVMTYGSETWTVNTEMLKKKKLRTTQKRMDSVLSCLEKLWRDKKTINQTRLD